MRHLDRVVLHIFFGKISFIDWFTFTIFSLAPTPFAFVVFFFDLPKERDHR